MEEKTKNLEEIASATKVAGTVVTGGSMAGLYLKYQMAQGGWVSQKLDSFYKAWNDLHESTGISDEHLVYGVGIGLALVAAGYVLGYISKKCARNK